jgi:hypothetical protein
MPIETRHGCTVVTGTAINLMQAIARKGALKLEILGMRRRGRPASVIIREAYGFKSKNKKALLAELEAWIEKNGPTLAKG